nr:succinylglutamate desuccinylase/aspartoacylase family protein [Candidatus Baldrarchaeota archaeon]
MFYHLFVNGSIKPDTIEVEKGVPLFIFRLGEGKPHVFLISGVHGDEQTGIYVAESLIEKLSKMELFGSITIVPVANPPAFRCKTHNSPMDGLNMNRIFPGNREGTVTERLAAEIWEQAIQADYIIDLHSCEEECIPYVLALHREFSYVKSLAYKVGIPYVIESTGTRGQLFVEASREGIPAIVIEMGGRCSVDLQSAVRVRDSLLNFLTSLGIIQGYELESKPEFYGRIIEINAPSEGLFIPKSFCGSKVGEESTIGEIKNGSNIIAPLNGLLVYIKRVMYVFKGEKIAGIAAKIKH